MVLVTSVPSRTSGAGTGGRQPSSTSAIARERETGAVSSRQRRRSPRPPATVAVNGSDPCPCGEPATYRDGCGRLHAGAAARTPEELMRSRYSAFVVHDADHLLRTWAAGQRPGTLDFDPGLRWTGLEIVGSTGGTAFHPTGTVHFRARFEDRGEPGVHDENSLFIREDGHWVYDRALEPGE